MPRDTNPLGMVNRRRFLTAATAVVGGGGGLTGIAAADHNRKFPLRPWHDDVQWESAKISTLDDPNENTLDKLWEFPRAGANTDGVTSTRCPDGSCPVVQWGVVAEAPGDPEYNGGRWRTQVALVQKPDDYANNWQPITSVSELMDAKDAGVITTEDRTFDAGPPRFFSCPMIRKID